ncbi:hypothetical protein [Roseimaritima sediminicola]|uniref:hypothetical protein n=1 Tax=Roseimaritima sediminicola TaxID=2662066 RepID=UPI00129823BF|nr:hypothetical protein [Roseimaritima sediminicola]
MRIPSNFSDRNLYRQRRDVRRESSQSMRRVVRLVLALGVVLVVMRQAADPKIYRPFFPEAPPELIRPGAGPTSGDFSDAAEEGPKSGEVGDGVDGSPKSGEVGDGVDGGPKSGDFSYGGDEDVRQWVRQLDREHQQRLTRWLATWRQRQSAASPEEYAVQADQAAALTNLRAAIESQVPAHDSDEAAATLGAVRAENLHALQQALDRVYQAAVLDGTIWRGADADAFYRYLELAAEPGFRETFLMTQPPPRHVGVVPLMQQPQAYLGRAVWMYGRVARAVPVEAKANPFGVQRYWEVWLRPDDGTERAVILYAPDVPEDVAAVGPEATLMHGPRIAAAGRFLKRRLYGAAGGAAESPVIVGRVWPRQPAAAAPETAPQEPSLVWLVGIAAAIGLALAGGLLWHSRVTSRQLRAARRSPPLVPKGLGDLQTNDRNSRPPRDSPSSHIENDSQ